MEEKVHFYSKYDMSIPLNLERANVVINKYKEGNRPKNVNDIIELYNIWLFIDNNIHRKDWDENILQLIRKNFKNEIISFFSNLKKNCWVEVYKRIELRNKKYFWEIIDRFNFDGLLDLNTLREVFNVNSYDLIDLLHQERLVNKHAKNVATLIKENEHSAEWLLQEYVEEDIFNRHKQLFFPKTLSYKEKEDIISRYLDSEKPNLNYVRLVLLAKKDSNLRLSDEIKLKAIHLEKKLNEEVFATGSTVHFKYTVSVNDAPNKPLKWMDYNDNGEPIFCYSKQLMKQFTNDEELFHYIRYVFEFLTPNGLIPFISKNSESDVMERLIGMTGKYAYPTNMAFRFYEAISTLQIEAMKTVLEEDGKSIESILKVFYQEYLNKKFKYPSGTLSLADNKADWITKCRTLAPEIDAIAQRYELYSKNGTVNEELLRISSDSIRITSVRSTNPIRYYSIKGQPDSLYRLFHLLFSNQSMLTFVEPFKENKYRSFYQMLIEQDEKICYSKYQEYQRRDIDFLLDEGYLSKNEDNMLCVEKSIEIEILHLLYDYHCCPFHTFGKYGQEILKEMEDKKWLVIDNHLLSEEERNYFDYYLYNSKYTNSQALRNRYVHGSHIDAKKENVHKNAYNRLLILLILELLKIEEDLTIQQKESETKTNEKEVGSNQSLISKIATVGTYSPSKFNMSSKVFLTIPKRYGLKDGYLYSNKISAKDEQSYYIQPHEGILAEYISFLMNSTLTRMAITNNSQTAISLTIEKLKSISLPLVPYNQQELFAILEHMIAQLMAKGNNRNREENLQLNVFSNLREYICLELLQTDFKAKTDIDFIIPFTEIMEKIQNKEDKANKLMSLLLTPGNMLMDNIKKARIILNQNIR